MKWNVGSIVIQVAISLMFLLIGVLAWLFWREQKRHEKLRGKLEMTNQVLNGIRIDQGLEANLGVLLDRIMPTVTADGYHFYVLDQRTNNYMLKASRFSENSPVSAEVSKSDLESNEKERYQPQVGIYGNSMLAKAAIIRDGAVPLLELPVRGGVGIIRLGPISSVTSLQKEMLNDFSVRLEPVLEVLLEIDKLKNTAGLVADTNKAVNDLGKSVFGMDGFLNRIMGLCNKLVEAGGGCLITQDGESAKTILLSGLDNPIELTLMSDQEALRAIYALGQDTDICFFSKQSKDFYQLPYFMVAAGIKSLLLVKMDIQAGGGTAVFWYYDQPKVEQHTVKAVQMLVLRMGELMERQSKFKELSESYSSALKFLVKTIDNLDPHTVGHSDLVSAYAVVIAQELNLSEQDTNEIGLAACFHDVGLLGLSSDVLFKPGKYNAAEFASMKLHADIGASIVESTMGNLKIAAYVRHHHERWDGMGYPDGLTGENIPVGARIIAVADSFNAKLSGRVYRKPAPFEQAVTDMLSLSGTLLDPVVVEALLNWFQRQQADSSRRGRSLQPCWEMRCCPKHIRENCIAHKKPELSCWDLNGVNCAAHGNECETCFVRTEILARDPDLYRHYGRKL